ncbi:hypothetical protein [Micromonospora chokoriensis]
MIDVLPWINEPEDPTNHHLRSAVGVKAVDTPPTPQVTVLDAQRLARLCVLRQLTRSESDHDLIGQPATACALHAEADMPWLDLTEIRLDELARPVRG